MSTARELEAIARGRICAFCRTEARVAFINGDHVLRCGCWPKPPALMKRPPSELTRALADPNYQTDAVTRMTAERILAKRQTP